MAENHMDPITLEIALHRLWQVTEEMGITLRQQAVKYSEDKFRARLGELPDGTWSTIYYQDVDVVSDKIYQMCLTMTKKGDDFVFDFPGTSE